MTGLALFQKTKNLGWDSGANGHVSYVAGK